MSVASPVDTAIVLALPVQGARPRHKLAGLTLPLRTVLTLQKEGFRRVFIAIEPGDSETAERIAADKRTRIEVHPIVVTKASDLRDVVTGPVLLARHDVVVDPAIYRALRDAELEEEAAVVATSGGEAVGTALITKARIEAMGDAAPVDLAGLAGARALDVGTRWHANVATKKGRERAFHELFEACRKPMDGIVARNINRHISIFISKRIVGVPVTPNMLSIFTFMLGVAGAYCCAIGGYWFFLLGAFLFQWNSILDGVDGELARVRFQHSRTGQWLDTVSDDMSNMVFYWGLAVGVAPLPYGPELAMCAWIGIAASMGATVQYYIEMIQVGSGDLYAIDWGFDKEPPPGIAGALIKFFRNALKKDFAILFFLGMALFGALPWILPIVAAAAVCTFIAATIRNVKKRRAHS